MYDLYAMAHTTTYNKAKSFFESDFDHPELSQDRDVQQGGDGEERGGL